jgi:GNAT superfamily N-acetyltransferase
LNVSEPALEYVAEMSLDPETRHRAMNFELGLLAGVGDENVEAGWGFACLAPSLSMAWDASWIAIEGTGMNATDVVALADEVMGGAGFAHRNVHVRNEAEGRRLAIEIAAVPGWEAGAIDYMIWQQESGREAGVDVAEATLAEIATLRQELIREPFAADNPDRERIVADLFARDERLGAAGGDRWFLAPAGDPAAVCRLLVGDGIGQIEDVVTAERARNRGLAQAAVLAALAASRTAGHRLTFLAADSAEWPRLMYEKLGFAKVGELHSLHLYP